MSLAPDLIGIGMPPEQAIRLGFSALTTVAGVGTAQVGGAAISKDVNNVNATTSGGQTALVLPDAELMMPYQVFAASATTALVYPPVGGIFNAQSVNTSVSIAQGQTATFMRLSSTQWVAVTTSVSSIIASNNLWTGQQFFRAASPAFLQTQGAPTAKTVTSAITAAELLTGIITTTGATAPSIHQLPTGSALSTAISGVGDGDSFDFSIINTGTGASDDATITVNTNVTIVGNPTVGALTDATIIAGSGRFRARETAANTWVVYRLA